MHDLIPAPFSSGALTTIEIETVLGYAEAAKAASTRRAYAADFADFAAWCTARGACPMPATSALVCGYVSWLAQSGKKASTIGRRVAAIAHHHAQAGVKLSPTADETVRVVMKGIRRTIGAAVTPKAPATADVMTKMLATCRSSSLLDIRDRALLALGFAGAFRRSELAALEVADLVEVDDGFRVLIRRSKGDQEGQGAEIAIPRGYRLRPVEAVKAWLAAASITEGRLFRAVANNRVTEELSAYSIALAVKRRLRACGIDPAAYAGHSLRSGFLTSAAESGASIWKMAAHSRHRSLDTLRGYVRNVEMFREHAGAAFL